MKEQKNDTGTINATELARMLGVSDQAVYKRIKAGAIKARKIGNNYLIDRNQIPELLGTAITENLKRQIDQSVKKIVRQYGEALRLLGKE
jgi:excisionase family DNA binding protein